MDRRFIYTIARFHKTDPLCYVITGYFQGNSIAGSHLHAFLDSKELPLRITLREGLNVRQKYFTGGLGNEEIDREYDLWITLPEDYDEFSLEPKTARNRTLEELKNSWIAAEKAPCLFISAKEKTGIEHLRLELYKMVSEIHAGRYPFNNFLW